MGGGSFPMGLFKKENCQVFSMLVCMVLYLSGLNMMEGMLTKEHKGFGVNMRENGKMKMICKTLNLISDL